jgi:FkbM family methyltransferase
MSILGSFATAARIMRTSLRIKFGIEPDVRSYGSRQLEYHGHSGGGWCILANSLNADSVVIDVGLGEDIEFSLSLMRRYGCGVHGFDPTPRDLASAAANAPKGFIVHPFGVGVTAGPVEFFLPANEAHVSGSIGQHAHLQRNPIVVNIVTLPMIMEKIGAAKIDLLKLDIEGTEFDLIASEDFRSLSKRVNQLCVEFHHRWPAYGSVRTLEAVRTLKSLGLTCAWRSRESNEEFLFVRAM